MKIFKYIRHYIFWLIIIIFSTLNQALCQIALFMEDESNISEAEKVNKVHEYLEKQASIIKKVRICRIDRSILEEKDIMLNLFPEVNLKVYNADIEFLDGNCKRWIGRTDGALFDNVIVDIYPNFIKGDIYTDIVHYCFWTIDGAGDACAVAVVEPPKVREINDCIIPDEEEDK